MMLDNEIGRSFLSFRSAAVAAEEIIVQAKGQRLSIGVSDSQRASNIPLDCCAPPPFPALHSTKSICRLNRSNDTDRMPEQETTLTGEKI